mgnify:CR=1 FL=1
MGIFASLNRQQKEAVGLLQIGTFLEYFDLMLYVHMAVLLNELFFPKTDPHTAALLSAFAFCSTYALRPFGALLFGWVGDTIGRKSTVILTTMMMAVSCLIMASLPTYSQIGITAAWIVTLCRVMQGISSMGEVVGAQIYLTEIIKPPTQYRVIAIIPIALSLGCLFALAIATLVTTSGFDWRNAFWIGASIAVVGSLARTRLRETPEFLNMKERQAKKAIEIEKSHFKLNKKNLIRYFLIDCSSPVFFYFTYIYCGTLMKNLFNYTPAEIIRQNMFVGFIDLLMCCIWLVFLISKPFPIKILKVEFFCIFPFVLFCPYILSSIETPLQLFLIQSWCTCFCLGKMASASVFIKHFPVSRRFTFLSFSFALSRAIIYVITAFGLVYLTENLGYYGLWVIMPPIALGFIFSVSHFEKLEKQQHYQIHNKLSTKSNEVISMPIQKVG